MVRKSRLLEIKTVENWVNKAVAPVTPRKARYVRAGAEQVNHCEGDSYRARENPATRALWLARERASEAGIGLNLNRNSLWTRGTGNGDEIRIEIGAGAETGRGISPFR